MVDDPCDHARRWAQHIARSQRHLRSFRVDNPIVLLYLQQSCPRSVDMTSAEHVAIQLPHAWQTELGPYLRASELANQLCVPADQIEGLVAEKELLEVRDAGGTRLYPVFALQENHALGTTYEVLPELKRLLEALARSCDEPWLWALWVSGWNPKHRGSAPIDKFRRGDESVLASARNEDWSWTAQYF